MKTFSCIIAVLIATAGLALPSPCAAVTGPDVHDTVSLTQVATADEPGAHDLRPDRTAAEHLASGITASARAETLATPLLDANAAPEPAMRIRIGKASHLLTGPWRFHPGDDMRRAEPDFDDSHWQTVDLTSAPGAHDADVGLTNYVPGWWARGHENYSGYAWYRLRVSVAFPADTDIAVLAPAYVEDAYQVFWNGTLIGGSGDFSGQTPVIYSTRPQILHVPPGAAGERDAVIAIRVWMRSGLTRFEDAGGIHIAPMLGTGDAIDAQYRLQWLQTFNGYVVEVVEPAAFVLLAILAWCFRAAMPSRRFVHWLCTALLLTSAYRLNQAVYAWTAYENLSTYLFVHVVLVLPALAAWLMAWRHWYRLERWRWLSRAIGIVTLVGVVLVLALPDDVFDRVKPLWRLPLAVVLLATAVAGLRTRQPQRWLAFVTVLSVAASQFSGELAALGVPSIWFPFGIGVSFTQYAYAAIIVSLAVLLVRRVQNREPGSECTFPAAARQNADPA